LVDYVCPASFQWVLVKASDLENTTYKFTLEDGEIHSAANLFDALKEGYYGKL
jgi:ribonucleoside-diphosphate reductase alpha chain